MGINLQLPGLTELRPRITVIGVGGAGGNAVNNMIESGLEGVEFIVANTDAQALAASSAGCVIQMGVGITEGLGAGSKPEIGAAAAEETIEEIRSHLEGVHLLFITAGMGGGTGTGAAPVIARTAKELGVLTVAVVTKPFEFEGQRRMRAAETGIANLAKQVDTLIIIPNQNLFLVASEKTTFADAFLRADDVLRSGVACITDLMVKEGLINLDFADVRTVMANMGTALMGTGEAEGDKARASGRRGSDHQSAAGRSHDARRQGAAREHHRQLRHDALRGRGGRVAHPPRGRSRREPRRQYHCGRDLRVHAAAPHPRFRRGDRHQARSRIRPAAPGVHTSGSRRPWRPAPCGRSGTQRIARASAARKRPAGPTATTSGRRVQLEPKGRRDLRAGIRSRSRAFLRF